MKALPCCGVPRASICVCCSALPARGRCRTARGSRPWRNCRPAHAPSPTVESGTGWFELQRPLADFGGQPARPFVGFVQVDVVERDADAQRADDLDLLVGALGDGSSAASADSTSARLRSRRRPVRRRSARLRRRLRPRANADSSSASQRRQRARRSAVAARRHGAGTGRRLSKSMPRSRAGRLGRCAALPARPAAGTARSSKSGGSSCRLDRRLRRLVESTSRSATVAARQARLGQRASSHRGSSAARRRPAASRFVGAARRPDPAGSSSAAGARERRRRARAAGGSSTPAAGSAIGGVGAAAAAGSASGSASGTSAAARCARHRPGRGTAPAFQALSLPAAMSSTQRPKPLHAPSPVSVRRSSLAGFWSASQVLSTCSSDQAASPNSVSPTMRELPLSVWKARRRIVSSAMSAGCAASASMAARPFCTTSRASSRKMSCRSSSSMSASAAGAGGAAARLHGGGQAAQGRGGRAASPAPTRRPRLRGRAGRARAARPARRALPARRASP